MGYLHQEDGAVTLDREGAEEVAKLCLDASAVLVALQVRLPGALPDPELPTKLRLAGGDYAVSGRVRRERRDE